MAKTKNEIEVRKRVLELQTFYKQLLLYVVISLSCILLSTILSKISSWPIWVILTGGGYLSFRAASLGFTSLIEDIFPFMRSEWVAEETCRRLAKTTKEGKATEKTVTRKTTAQKATNLPSTQKKKSVAPKKAAVAKKTTKKSS